MPFSLITHRQPNRQTNRQPNRQPNRRIACGLLLLFALTSCGNPSPSPDAREGTPNSGTTSSVDRADPEPSSSGLTPPGQVDRAKSSETDTSAAADTQPSAAAPNTAPNTVPNAATDNSSIRVLSCQTSSGLVNDPNAPLNVRSAPDTSVENVVGSLDDGVLVSIVGDRDNWWQIDAPEAGWVSKNLIDSTCNEKIARIELPPNTASVTLSDRFFGTGYHHYQLTARAGQKLTLEALNETGPLPFVLTADDRDITNGIANTNAMRWSGTLPEDGDYTIVFDSNFRGYTYEIMLSVE